MVCSKALCVVLFLFFANSCESRILENDFNSHKRTTIGNIGYTAKNVGPITVNTGSTMVGMNPKKTTTNVGMNMGNIGKTKTNVKANTQRTMTVVGSNTANTGKTNTIGVTNGKGTTAKVGMNTANIGNPMKKVGTNAEKTTTVEADTNIGRISTGDVSTRTSNAMSTVGPSSKQKVLQNAQQIVNVIRAKTGTG